MLLSLNLKGSLPMTTANIGDLWKFDLRKGPSTHPRNGACLLDAVSWFEYGQLGDHPDCVCPVIAAYARGINDTMDDTSRQRLKIYLPRLIGTVDPASEQTRARFLAWQAIHVFAPLALDAAGLKKEARTLRKFKGTLPEAATAALAAATAARAAESRRRVNTATATTAARAATWATHAASNASDAGWATARAARAADAAWSAADAAWMANTPDLTLIALDGVLAIGKQADPIEAPRFQKAVDLFELARGR